MQKLLLVATLFGAVIASPVYAQNMQTNTEAPTVDKTQHHEDRFVARLNHRLTLSSEQINQIKTIIREQNIKKKAHREETRQRIEMVLTPEQVAKFKEMKPKHHGHN